MYNTPSPARGEAVELSLTLGYEAVSDLFDIARVRRALTHTRREQFPLVADAAAALEGTSVATVSHSERARNGCLQLLLELPDDAAVAYLSTSQGGTGEGYLHVAARTLGQAESASRRLVAVLRGEPTPDDRVAMHMWSRAGRSPSSTRRVLDAPLPDEVAGNYPPAARRELLDACRADPDRVRGLALWYGPPGTGKTTAVRTLARAWRRWCDVHVVIDPDNLLHDPGYLMKVITERTYDDDLPDDALPPERRARLVVLEDSGELLSADARARTGQGLSRLLNVSDGLVGRGLGTSILITTNEELGSLHPAIRRPGRCWAQVRFGRFAAADARAWLDERGVDSSGVVGSRSLAELFAIERGDDVDAGAPAAFGFSAS